MVVKSNDIRENHMKTMPWGLYLILRVFLASITKKLDAEKTGVSIYQAHNNELPEHERPACSSTSAKHHFTNRDILQVNWSVPKPFL